MRHRPGWAETVDLVADRLRLHLPTPDILTAEQRYGDPLSYRCHLLHAESDGSFSVVALVWRPGPGHADPRPRDLVRLRGHAGQRARGPVHAARSTAGWRRPGSSVSRAGDVTGLVPPGDIHRVRNDGPQTAISLHIYGTDVSRLGTSVRRAYDLPVLAGSPPAEAERNITAR